MNVKNNVSSVPKITVIIILIYLSLFVIDKIIFKGNLFEWGSGKGFNT